MLVWEGSLYILEKLLDVSGPSLGEAGRYRMAIDGDGGAAGARRLRLRVLRTAKEEQKFGNEARDGSGGHWG